MTGEIITCGLSLYYIAAFQTMRKLNKMNEQYLADMNPWVDFSVQLIISISTLHCSTKWQTKKEPQSILYTAWKAKTKRSMCCK